MLLSDLAGSLHPHVHRLRADAPVAWVPAIDGWMVTGWQEALAVLKDAATFTVDDPRFSTGQVVGPSMLSTDGAAQTRHRSPFATMFQASKIRAHESWIRHAATELVDSFADGEGVELRTALAAPLAVDSILHVLGLSGSASRADVLGWYQAIVDSVGVITEGGEPTTAGRDAMAQLGAAVDAAALAIPPGLSSDEHLSNLAVIMFGAIETSEGMIANLFHHLLHRPAVLKAVRNDRSLVPKAIEESLRMEPAAAVVDRYTTSDVSLGGAEMKKGDFVSVSLAGANRDPLVFANPDAFRLDRPNARDHLAFVRGPHACIGAQMARLEATAALDAVLDLSGLELVPEASKPPSGLVFRKPEAIVARIWL